MTNVSKKPLKKEIRTSINKQFAQMLMGRRGGGEKIIAEIFTEKEHIMLAKRAAMLILLASGISPYKVRKMLKLSYTTAWKAKQEMEKGAYPEIRALVKKKEERKKFWMSLEVVLRAGMPEMGRGRWKFLDEIYGKR